MNRKLFKRLLRDTGGLAAIEYGLITMVLGVALIGSFMSLGGEVEGHYEDIGTEYENANNA